MGKFSQKLTGIVIAFICIAILPVIASATNEEVQIVQTENQKYIIYLENGENKEFNYAISEDESTAEMDLEYIHSEIDEEGNQVALVDSSVYDFTRGDQAYFWVKEGEDQIISAKRIDFSTAFKKENMEEVENTTKRIGTEIVSDLAEEDRVDEQGVHITVSIGGIKITDTDAASYFYQTIPATGEYETLMNLAEKIRNDYDSISMYTKIATTKEFYSLYERLLENAEWQAVENMTIRQPKEATEGSKYVVFIKKVEEDNVTLDVQFLTCQEVQTPKYEKEKIVTQETTKLPITGDNLILIIVFAVVVIALILVFIRMKKLNEKNDGKKD